MHKASNGYTKSFFSQALNIRQRALNLNLRIDVNGVKRKALSVILVSTVILLMMTQTVLSALESHVSINMSGAVRTNPAGNLIFSSGFEDSRDGYIQAEGYNALRIINTVTGNPANTYMYPSGSAWWIEGRDTTHRPSGAPAVASHTGSYCLGLAKSGGNTRCEFQLRDWNWHTHDEYYFRMWVYFPSNWDVSPSSNGWEVLFAFGDSVYAAPQGYPYIDIALWAKGTPGSYSLVLEGRGFSNEGHTYNMKTNWNLPRGQWSKWEIYFDRGDADAANGSVWVKVNDVQYLSSTGNVYAKASVNGNYNGGAGAQLEIYPQDLYSGGSGNEYRYLDDLEIWSGLPT